MKFFCNEEFSLEHNKQINIVTDDLREGRQPTGNICSSDAPPGEDTVHQPPPSTEVSCQLTVKLSQAHRRQQLYKYRKEICYY